ncbi:peptidylprolyl isomerase [Litoribacillus peritrichatus]|uniref:Peptidyl-prolyl cis-trans isomerase n=1 Tax=Litoribacillus peritrichatus TaxID=718191 RepID=A0ABP7M4G9_9GAMM
MIRLTTNFGNIDIQLDYEKAPNTAKNFEEYVKSGFYDGVIFHRVIDGFMVQGGGFDADMKEKTTNDPIKNEANNGLSNMTGTIAMARTMDPHSASAQFFINVADNTFLDHTAETMEGWGYAVFGKVVEGMDIVNQIKKVSTTVHMGYQDVPAQTVTIEKAEIIEE